MNITFTNTIDVDIDLPVAASNVIPDWYRQMESYMGGEKKPNGSGQTTATLKRCMPVFDSIAAGYIIKTPADVYVKVKDGQQYFEWANLNLIQFHDVIQAPTHPMRKGDYSYPKWTNPWGIETPKGYSTLFVQPFHRESIFTIFPGIVDTDSYTAPVNFPFVINDPEFEGLIPAGTPMVQVIPFKRDTWNMKFGNEKNIKNINNIKQKVTLKFFDGYKTMFRSKKEYR
jgi:hypothetical protein